jgi:hypothetical protein
MRVPIAQDVAVLGAVAGEVQLGLLEDADEVGLPLDHCREVVAVAVLVADGFDEQHEQDVVLVLAGIHAATQFVATGPEGGVEVGFLQRHEVILGNNRFIVGLPDDHQMMT